MYKEMRADNDKQITTLCDTLIPEMIAVSLVNESDKYLWVFVTEQ